MNEVTLRNESLGLSMTKATINGIDVVLAENVREALEWDRISNMVRGLKNGKEVLKIRVSDLDSTLKGFCPNLGKTSEKGGSPQEHVRFLTHHGVARPDVDSIHIVIQLRFIVLGVITKFSENLQKRWRTC